jgi:hypothetical protein
VGVGVYLLRAYGGIWRMGRGEENIGGWEEERRIGLILRSLSRARMCIYEMEQSTLFFLL